ncbi:prolyl oligopeptidase family serine peptidase [bacterium]|nr:prolyl oligopeptidase family serine peptidase [bacterium]MCI0603309.1 prolyl oligopeptidase family serine peptidase [bacterium]
MKRAALTSLLIFLFSSLLAATPKLEDILSSPFPYSLVSATEKDRVAWVFNERGRRNIWVGDGPEYKPQRITDYQDDDGQELSGLTFSKDAEFIVYVRGGDPNSKQEYPNPNSDPAGAKQEVWAVSIVGGTPIRIGEGSSPAISPDSKTIAFVKSGQIYSAAMQDPKEAKQLLHARGQNFFPVWSPDGARLAFVSFRDDHNFIGVYDPTTSKITWLSPDVDLDFQPVWSADSKQIAFLRFPGKRAEPDATWEPTSRFSIWIADAETGAGRKVWTSPDESGGFAQYYSNSPLMWGAENRLLFYWETDGWIRIYSVSTAGGKEISLTPAGCETEHALLSADRKQLIFNSNCGDIDRRHLWMVPVGGGSPKKLTQGNGIEWSPVVAGANVIFLCSTARQPAAPAAIPMAGGNPRLLAPERLETVPVKELVEPQQVIFKSMDGTEVHGQLFLPSGSKTKLPALIYMHGGPIRQMLTGWHYMDYYHNAYGMNQYLAANGYAVLAVNFRCGIGYGRAFRRAENQGPYGASEYQDIVAAARLLQKRTDIDANRIGLWGGSYGGYLTALGLARDSELFAAGVDLHGVHDWALRAKLRGAEDWGIRGDEMMRRAFDSSPVADVATWTSPVLFIIGDDDRNVDFIETTDLVQRLRKEGKASVETLIFPDEVHDLLRHKNWLRTFHATLDFFNRHLEAK